MLKPESSGMRFSIGQPAFPDHGKTAAAEGSGR